MLTAAPVTLKQLLTLDLIGDYEVLAGEDGLHRPVRALVVGSTVHEISELVAGSVVVFSRETLAVDSLALDLAIRLAGGAGLSGIVVARTSRQVPLVTRRIADRLALPLIGIDDMPPAAVVTALDPYVRAPEIAGLRVLAEAARRFQHPPGSANALTTTLAAIIGEPVSLVDSENRLAAGDHGLHELLGNAIPAECLGDPRPAPQTVRAGDHDVLLQPVLVDPAGPAVYWIAIRLPDVLSGALLDPVRRAVGIAALSFAVRVASDSVRAERETQRRSLLLNEILEQPDDPGRRTLERAAALGWRLAGRHTAVLTLVVSSSAAFRPAGLAAELEEQLADRGVTATLIERGEGWLFWTTDTDDTSDARSLTTCVRAALRAVEIAHPGLRLCAGVGDAHSGAKGLRRSSEEARRAALLAQTTHRSAAVEHVDVTGARRVLAHWYGSVPMREAAAELLAPLAEADPSGDLIRTLRAYLDSQQSAKATGARLGVHRNTVMQRMDRIGQLLTVDLEDPDDRLAVHLAARAIDIAWDPRV